MVIALLLLAGGLASPAAAATGQQVADLAVANLNRGYCQANSLGGVGYGLSCQHPVAWCADFAKWVWQNSGLQVGGLDSGASSFFRYGRDRGTWHTTGPKAGDAVVFGQSADGSWAQHVGLVTAVYGNGRIQIINGNYGDGSSNPSLVRYSEGEGRAGASVNGQVISGFTTPVGLTDARRIGVVDDNGVAIVKEGAINAGWGGAQHTGVVSVSLAGNRIGVLLADGRALVKEGGLSAGWAEMYTDVTVLRLSAWGNRIGVVNRDGVARVKEGGLSAAWSVMDSNVSDLQMTGDRIAVLHRDNTVWVKQGGLGAGWDTGMAADVRQVVVTGWRIGVLRTDNTVWVKEGALNAAWDQGVDSNVRQLAMSGDRIGVVHPDNTVWVKQGAINAGWDKGMAADVSDLVLEGDRIGIRRTDGYLWVKEGALNAAWEAGVASGVRQAALT